MVREARALTAAFFSVRPVWSRDSQRLVYVSNREGPYRAFSSRWMELALPSDRLDLSEDVASCADITPDNLSVILRVFDPQAQHWQLRRIDVVTMVRSTFASIDGADLGRPIFSEDARDQVLLPAFDAHTGNTSFFVQRPIGAPSRAAGECAGRCEFVDVARNGSHAIARCMGSDASASFIELEVHAGSTTRIDLEPAIGTITAAAYDRDDRTLLIAASTEKEGACIFQRDPATSAIHPVRCFAGATRIRSLHASSRTRVVVAAVDTTLRTELRLLRGTNLKQSKVVQLPAGVGTIERIASDGKVVTFTWETPTTPPDLYDLDTTSGRPRKLRLDVRPTLALFEEMAVREVASNTEDGTIVYAPEGTFEAGARKRPVVLLVRRDGKVPRLGWSLLVRWLVARGLAVVEPVTVTAPSIERAAAWAAEQPWAMAGKVGIVGTAEVVQVAAQRLEAAQTVVVVIDSAELDRSEEPGEQAEALARIGALLEGGLGVVGLAR